MLLSRKRSTPASHPSPSTSENIPRSLRAYLTRKVHTSVTHSDTPRPTKARQALLAPKPDYNHPCPTSKQEIITQFLWEDINPPGEYPNSYPQTGRPSSSYSEPRNISQEAKYKDTSQTTLNQHHHQAHFHPSSVNANMNMAPSPLPEYNDVSGAVVVDVDGYPHFLTPQEERDREMKLESAVRERMLGLPRRTDFSWEPSSNPILPRYKYSSLTSTGGKRV